MTTDDHADLCAAWMRHMRCGDLESAWRICDRVLQLHHPSTTWQLERHEQNIWDGSSLEGKRVLVRCYHGLGDTIQFIRYAEPLKQIAREVIVWVQPELIPLVRKVAGVDRAIPLTNGIPEIAFDADIESMELAHYFRSTLSSIPKVPYLHAEPAQIAIGEGLNVGLVWRAGNWDARRNIPFAAFKPLADLENIHFHILQQSPHSAGWDESLGIHHGELPLCEFARVVAALDLVISIDSMPAHLAGALGQSVWTLLHEDADWRWMSDRCDSPWYPTMQLFRQRVSGDWSGVLEDVLAELRKAAEAKHTAKSLTQTV